ncbi:hypothetical protein [Flavobacterium oreochromis]|uniref:Uncharacterized protein n=2 Tax=Flavobacterium TaxID=237 RepID=A0ABW8P707_9FLAO|nr:hypothetical protein [Flavobacterium oreochromis]OWP76264.1 hypothetical protein BWG23_08425 [Flavobacterium oreochromis]QYS85668.1 hypothetical protein JJC03_10800 [Flavobacterium oreochromis]
MSKINRLTFLGSALLSVLVNAQEKVILKEKELFGDIKARHIDPALMGGRITDLQTHPNNNKVIYTGTAGVGVYRSWDLGETLEMVSSLPVSQFYHLSIDTDKVPYHVYGGLQDNGSWYGLTKSLGGIESRDWTRGGQGDGFKVIKHLSKNIIYSEMQGAENVWRYNIDTQELITIQPLQVKGDPKLRFN